MLMLLCAGCGTGVVESPVTNTTAHSLSIQDVAVAPAIDGMPYNTALSAVGGTPGYQWAVTAGNLPAGLALSPSSGVITGVASLTGTANFAVSVSDHSDPVQTTSASISLVVVSPFSLPQVIMPSGEVGTSYSSAIQATGGTTPYSWLVTSGALPPGMGLNTSSGVISGVPTTAGTYSFAVTANDSSNPVQYQTSLVSILVAVPVAPPQMQALSFLQAVLPAGEVGLSYSDVMQATGGTAPYHFALSSGTLPLGVVLNAATGTLSGTPTTAGGSAFAITVTDSGNPLQSQTAQLSIVVAPTALSMQQPSFPSAQLNSSYAYNLKAAGGTLPYHWTVSSGRLPVGITLNATTGVLTGTATTAGTSTFAINVTDSSSIVQSQTAQAFIVVAPPILSVLQPSLLSAQVNVGYAYMLQATGGSTPYHWAISSGSLPAGVVLNATTGALSGIPTTAGTSAFAVAVVDSSNPVQSQTEQMSIIVAPAVFALQQTSLSPGQVGVGYNAAVKATGGLLPYHWTISSGNLPAGVVLDAGTGDVSGTPKTSGTSTFTISVSDSSNPVQLQAMQMSLVVNPATLSLQPPSLPPGQVNANYAYTLKATGGVLPYHWTLVTGTLPAGLALNAVTGTLSGNPTTTGTSTFAVAITDSSNPTQSQTESMSIVIAAPALSLQKPSLPSGQVNVAYTQSLAAIGGTMPYRWNVSSGALPAGTTLNANTGVIMGTPNTVGTFAFAVSITDSSSPTQSQIAQASIVIAAPALSFQQPSPPSAQVASAYTYSLSATGGTAPYRWSVSSGALPAGIALNTTTSVITGIPTTSGTFSFGVSVIDSGNPAQSQNMSMAILVVAAPAAPAPPSTGATWYVRPDGGSRYSSNMQNGQCNGKSDVAYPGQGTNQACAFNDVRYLWQDGSYTVDASQSAFPAYGWIGNGGDTYLIRGSLSSGVSWRIGYPTNSDMYDPTVAHYWGVAGDPYGSGIPQPLSGTASQHTRILGENFASCHAPSAKTQLHGGYGVSAVLNMTGVSYVDIACLDITDFSSCGRASQTNTCNSTIGQLSDYATNGISWSRASTNDTVTDVSIHGLASAGMIGPTGDGVVFSYVDLIGNASSGWNADAGDGTTGTGSLLMQHYNISWNGCAEEYPIVDALPYQDCTDDNIGGYGDGFGTATTPSNPAWNVTFDQGIVTYNTQDGLDSLHLIGSESSVTVTRTQAYGNMGQQIKVGGASGTAINNLIVTNCNAMRQAIPGTPAGYNSRLSDYCRAADTGIVLKVGPQTRLTYDFNTIYSASATAIEIDCDTTNGPCNATSTIDFRNNIFVGFLNNAANGYPSGGTGGYSNPVYNGSGVDFFGNSGSLFINNFTFHPSGSWTCPANHELAGVCGDPGLTDESWHVYGVPAMTPGQSSSAVAAGVSIPGVTLDYAGLTRPSSPTIGGLEP